MHCSTILSPSHFADFIISKFGILAIIGETVMKNQFSEKPKSAKDRIMRHTPLRLLYKTCISLHDHGVGYTLKLIRWTLRSAFGYEDTPEKRARFERETELFCSLWKQELEAGDPYFNPNFVPGRMDFNFDLPRNVRKQSSI